MNSRQPIHSELRDAQEVHFSTIVIHDEDDIRLKVSLRPHVVMALTFVCFFHDLRHSTHSRPMRSHKLKLRHATSSKALITSDSPGHKVSAMGSHGKSLTESSNETIHF
jgi:hypothetical protein